jgi:dihydroxyacid dehydratase/phosphogluconate dehydratase
MHRQFLQLFIHCFIFVVLLHYLPQQPSRQSVLGRLNNQEQVMEAFEAGELERDFIAVVRNQGPRANGMPELHKLTAPLGVPQDRTFRMALVTDGRMSGASGKIPAAIHLTPNAGPAA